MESQSRYSIVERLTQKKLEIISSKSKLNDEAKQLGQKVVELENDFTDWQESVKKSQKEAEREFTRNIARAKTAVENFKANLTDKAETYDQKIKVIDDALKSIERISGDAPTPQQQAQ